MLSNETYSDFIGTNDKAGMATYMLKWMSPRSIKETLVNTEDWKYKYMDS